MFSFYQRKLILLSLSSVLILSSCKSSEGFDYGLNADDNSTSLKGQSKKVLGFMDTDGYLVIRFGTQEQWSSTKIHHISVVAESSPTSKVVRVQNKTSAYTEIPRISNLRISNRATKELCIGSKMNLILNSGEGKIDCIGFDDVCKNGTIENNICTCENTKETLSFEKFGEMKEFKAFCSKPSSDDSKNKEKKEVDEKEKSKAASPETAGENEFFNFCLSNGGSLSDKNTCACKNNPLLIISILNSVWDREPFKAECSAHNVEQS